MTEFLSYASRRILGAARPFIVLARSYYVIDTQDICVPRSSERDKRTKAQGMARHEMIFLDDPIITGWMIGEMARIFRDWSNRAAWTFDVFSLEAIYASMLPKAFDGDSQHDLFPIHPVADDRERKGIHHPSITWWLFVTRPQM